MKARLDNLNFLKIRDSITDRKKVMFLLITNNGSVIKRLESLTLYIFICIGKDNGNSYCKSLMGGDFPYLVRYVYSIICD